MHDAPSTSYKHYCYKSTNILSVRYKGKRFAASFEQLYDLLEEGEAYDISIGQNAKFPSDLWVEDLQEG